MTTSLCLLTVLAAGIIAGLGTPASADSATVTASADSYVRSDLVNNNYGTSSVLYTDAAGATSPEMKTFLRFDLSGQPSDRTIESAILRVTTTAASTSGSVGTMEFKVVADDSWTEAGLKWSNAPAAGTTVGSLSDTAYGQQYSVNLDPGAVQEAVGSSLSLQVETTSTDSLAIASKEGTLGAPALDITYGPRTDPPADAGIEPIADSYTNAAATGMNYGSTQRMYADGDGSTPALRSYLKFDLSRYDGATLSGAALQVHTDISPGASAESYAVRSVPDSSWTESGLTWGNQPALGSTIGTVSAPYPDLTYTFPLDKDAVQAALGGDFSVAIEGAAGDGLTIASRNHKTMAHPRLLLSFRGSDHEDPVVWAVGDLCDSSHACADTANLIQGDGSVSALLLAGDVAYKDGTDADFESLDGYFGSRLLMDGSTLASKSLPTPGNHEYRTPYASGYFKYFAEENGLTFVGRYDRASWYAKDIGNWRIISVNSNYASEPSTTYCNTWCQAGVTSTTPAVGGLTATQAARQRYFLAAELNDAQAKGMGTIVLDHHPALTDGDYAPGTQLGRDLFVLAARRGAEMFISGHSHNSQRFTPRGAGGRPNPAGVAQYLVGGGGRQPFDSFTDSAAAWRDNTHHAAARIVLHDEFAEVTFKGTDGSTLDSSTVTVH